MRTGAKSEFREKVLFKRGRVREKERGKGLVMIYNWKIGKIEVIGKFLHGKKCRQGIALTNSFVNS